MKKKDNYILLIIVAIILISILGIMYFSKSKENDSDNKEIQYKLLNDYSRFFTVNSCVYKYITYLSTGDVDNVLNVLDDEYIENNNINKNNLYNYINKLEGSYNFKAKKIYYGEITKNYIEYLVYGYLINDSLDSVADKQDFYIKVKMDLDKELFSVSPYDGRIFKEGN